MFVCLCQATLVHFFKWDFIEKLDIITVGGKFYLSEIGLSEATIVWYVTRGNEAITRWLIARMISLNRMSLKHGL